MNSRLVLLPLAAAILTLAACASPTQGTGTPADSSSASTSSSTTNPTTSTGGAGLAAVQPCDLLTSTAASQNGLKSEGPGTEGTARACNWSNTTADNGLGYSLGIAVRDSQGLADINTAGLTLSDDTVGHHQGKQVEDTTAGDCFVAIGVSTKSRVDVVISGGSSNLSESCSLANHFAQLIEPALP